MYSIDENDTVTEKTIKFPINILLSEANKYLRLFLFDKAMSFYQLILDSDSNNFKALLGRAKCHFKLGNYEEAHQDFERILKIKPKYMEAIYLKSAAEYFRGNFEESFNSYWEGSKQKPCCNTLRQGYRACKHILDNSLHVDASTRLRKEDISEMKSSLQTALAAKKEETEESERYDKNGLFSKDLMILDRILKDTDLTSIHANCRDVFQYLKSRQRFMKMLHLGMSKRHKTQSLRNKIRRSSMTDRLLYRLDQLRSYVEDGNTGKCIKAGNEILHRFRTLTSEKFPDKAENEALAFHYLGLAYMLEGRTASAVACFEKQLSIGRKNKLTKTKGRALRDLGEIFFKNRQYHKAFSYFQESSALASSDEQAIFLYKLADCAIHLNNLEYARAAANACMQLVTDYNDSRFQLDVLLLSAEIAVKCKNMQVAYGYFEEALKRANDYQDFRLQEIEKLLVIFQEATGKKPCSNEKLQIVNTADKHKRVDFRAES